MITGHESTPRDSDPDTVIDRKGKDGSTETRAFYDENGRKTKELTNHDHGNPKNHPYGKKGEHAHDYEWFDDGRLKKRTTRDWTDQEKDENGDML